MKMIGIVGSPRLQGNTHVLVEAVLAGAAAAGALTETLFLRDCRILPCDGCHACWRGHSCVKKDDMGEVYRRIAAADALVLGTPVYWYGPTAMMKGMVDRFVFYNCEHNRIQIRGKAAAVVVPFEEEDPGVAEPVLDFFRRSLTYLELSLQGELAVPGVTRRGEAANRPEVMAAAAALGRRLALYHTGRDAAPDGEGS